MTLRKINPSVALVLLFIFAQPVFAQFQLRDVTREAGIDLITANSSDMSAGTIVLDYDNDGWEDLFLTGGQGEDKLYRNNSNGTFTDVTAEAKLVRTTATNTNGGAAFDIDNDGWTDIFLSCEGRDILYHNQKDGTFKNVSRDRGIVSPIGTNFNAGVTFGDIDNDGDNDFFVARWIDSANVVPDPAHPGWVKFEHKGLPDQLYLNNGDGTFAERAREYGVDNIGTGLISNFLDYDLDGDLDILVGNDFGAYVEPNAVYQNQLRQTGSLSFVNVAASIGLDQKLFTMGIGAGDYDRDGDLDLFETTIGPHVLLRNDNGQFVDVSKEAGVYKVYPVSDPPVYTTHWSAIFVDLDNDAWEDLYVVHGTLKSFPPWSTIPTDTTVFYRNLGGSGSVGKFEERSTSTGFLIDVRARTGTILDYNHDGRMDLTLGALYNAIEFPSLGYYLIKNESPAAGNYLQLDLRAKAPHPVEAIGAIIRVWTQGVQQLRVVSTGGSMLSQNTLVQHIGLGSAQHADSISIQWPNARRTEVRYNVAANTRHRAEEGSWASSKSVATSDDSEMSIHSDGRLIFISGGIGFTYSVFDVLGKPLLTGGTSHRIDLSSLTPGAYMLMVHPSNGAPITKRILRF